MTKILKEMVTIFYSKISLQIKFKIFDIDNKASGKVINKIWNEIIENFKLIYNHPKYIKNQKKEIV